MIPREVLDSYLFTFVGASRLWSINPYRHCEFNCTYCITKTQGDSEPFYSLEETVATVESVLPYVPPDIPLILGGYTDPYPQTEERLGITRAVLEMLYYYGRPISICSKGTLMGRDTDILFGQERGTVSFSFSSLDNELSKPYEPGTPHTEERLALLHKFVELGIDTRVSLQPWIPGVTDIQEMVDATPDNVLVTVDRLKIVKDNRRFKIGDRMYDQATIDALFMIEMEKFEDNPRVQFNVDPRYLARRENDGHPYYDALVEQQHHLDNLLHTGRIYADPIELIPAYEW